MSFKSNVRFLEFFERLRLRVTGTFLTEALVILGVASWAEGSSAITGEVEGTAIVSFGGSSSSLQEETSYVQHEREKASMMQSQNSRKTYDAMRSKNSTPSSRTGALITHKYKGSCVAFSISKSVEPNEELKIG
jgi:hypothetical protein